MDAEKQANLIGGTVEESNPEQLRDFYQFVQSSSLSSKDQTNLRFLVEYCQGLHLPILSSRSYLFTGRVGVGKTHLAAKLLNVLQKPILYVASTKFPLRKAQPFKSLKELLPLLSTGKEQIIFLDDLNCILDKDEGSITPESRRQFMSLLDWVKKDPKKILIATINEVGELEEQMIDRMEVKIEVDVPSSEHKKRFIQTEFGDYLAQNTIQYTAINSIGYNYRDLPEVVRLAYRLGEGKITSASLKASLKNYVPTQLYRFRIENGITTNLHDIIGKEAALQMVKRIVRLHQQTELRQKLGLQHQNLLLFHGPAGSGKTFMARALAGELGYPIISLSSSDFERPRNILPAIDIARRYQDCVVFIDEAEKMIGNNRFGEDNIFIGELNNALNGISDMPIKAIFVMAVNELSRFGDALRDRFVEVPFSVPSCGERLTFYKAKGKNFPAGVDYEYLAKKSEGYSFRELERCWNTLMYHYLEHKTELSSQVIRDLLKESAVDDNVAYG